MGRNAGHPRDGKSSTGADRESRVATSHADYRRRVARRMTPRPSAVCMGWCGERRGPALRIRDVSCRTFHVKRDLRGWQFALSPGWSVGVQSIPVACALQAGEPPMFHVKRAVARRRQLWLSSGLGAQSAGLLYRRPPSVRGSRTQRGHREHVCLRDTQLVLVWSWSPCAAGELAYDSHNRDGIDLGDGPCPHATQGYHGGPAWHRADLCWSTATRTAPAESRPRGPLAERSSTNRHRPSSPCAAGWRRDGDSSSCWPPDSHEPCGAHKDNVAPSRMS